MPRTLLHSKTAAVAAAKLLEQHLKQQPTKASSSNREQPTQTESGPGKRVEQHSQVHVQGLVQHCFQHDPVKHLGNFEVPH